MVSEVSGRGILMSNTCCFFTSSQAAGRCITELRGAGELLFVNAEKEGGRSGRCLRC